MDEGMPRLQERPLLEPRDLLGLDYSSLYLCKPKRSAKRDDGKDAYKLPHRLIEKKRRDRINECIAQLKDLLPEHLKLTTLGHLEKAVVLELTLKHLKALTALTEQQHQKILALQSGERALKSPLQADLDAFHAGFQTCAKEVLQYLSRCESWAPREPRCAQLLGHLRAAAARPPPAAPAAPPAPEPPARCVPVIRRTRPGAEPDTDTDSGYGGEPEAARPARRGVKQEPPGPDAEPPAPKRRRPEPARPGPGPGPGPDPLALLRPDAALLGSLLGPLAPPAAPLCLPLCLLSPPLLDKFLCPAAAAPFPLLCPGLPGPAAAAFPCLSSAAAFPCLSSVLSPPPDRPPAAARAPRAPRAEPAARDEPPPAPESP